MKNANIGYQKDRGGEKGEKEITVNLTEGCFFFFSALNSEYKLNQTVKLDICLVTSYMVCVFCILVPLLPQNPTFRGFHLKTLT